MLGLGGHLDAADLEQATAISAAFERADFNGDGAVSFAELSDIFRELGTWTDQELNNLFDAADRNADGFVRYKDFTAWLMGAWNDGGKQATDAIASLPVASPQITLNIPTQARLFFVRHAKPEWWDRRKYSEGAVRDPGLSEVGISQAQSLAAELQTMVQAFDVIVCSPLARALQTAAPLIGNPQKAVRRVICHAQTCEHGSKPSDFHPSLIAEAQPRLLGNNAAHDVEFVGFDSTCPDDTESRAKAVAEWLQEQSKTWPQDAVVGIVSHQTFLDCLLQVLVLGDSSGWEYGWPKFKIEKACFHEFAVGPNKVNGVKQNGHYHPEVAEVQDTDEAAAQEPPSPTSSTGSFGSEREMAENAAEQAKIGKMQLRGKRPSICAGSVSKKDVDDFVKPVYPKSAIEEAELLQIIQENEKMQVLCGAVATSALQDIVNAFQLKEANQGDDVIRQGDDGDYLYICFDGNLDIFVARPGPDGRIAPGDRGGKVLSVGKGALFGELALMYTAPRAATVTVVSATAKLWALHQKAFKVLLQQAGEKQFQMYEGWLREVELLKPFNHHELSLLADVMESSLFDTDEEIVTQGDVGDTFYIIEDGTCSAYISGADGEKEVKDYNVGGYFGEIALLKDEPRRATVRATGSGCAVISISKEDFTNILGPITEQLEKDISAYPKYNAIVTE